MEADQEEMSPECERGVGGASAEPFVRYPDGVEERDGFLWQDGERLMTRDMILKEQNAHTGSMWFVPPDATLVAELPAGEVVKPKRKRKNAKPVEKPIDPRGDRDGQGAAQTAGTNGRS